MTTTKLIGGISAGLATLGLVAGIVFGSGDPASASTTEPSICSFEDGRFCTPCSSCPQADTGWLCCSQGGGTCVPVAIDGVCSEALGNFKGHCQNYEIIDAATNEAICHDAA